LTQSGHSFQSGEQQLDTAKLNDWMQIVGIFALVASLIFVGLQIRQEHQISMAQAYQGRATISAEVAVELASNALALSAHRKAAEGNIDAVTPPEYDAALWVQVAMFHIFDNTHFQYVNGYVSEDLWIMIRGNLKVNMTNPLGRKIFDDIGDRARPSFREVLLEIGAEIDTDMAD
jgi:hypothetical protein